MKFVILSQYYPPEIGAPQARWIVWYDFYVRGSGNPDVRAIGKREIRALLPSCDVRFRRMSFAPPIVRALDAVPLLRTHYLAVIRPSS